MLGPRRTHRIARLVPHCALGGGRRRSEQCARKGAEREPKWHRHIGVLVPHPLPLRKDTMTHSVATPRPRHIPMWSPCGMAHPPTTIFQLLLRLSSPLSSRSGVGEGGRIERRRVRIGLGLLADRLAGWCPCLCVYVLARPFFRPLARFVWLLPMRLGTLTSSDARGGRVRHPCEWEWGTAPFQGTSHIAEVLRASLRLAGFYDGEQRRFHDLARALWCP